MIPLDKLNAALKAIGKKEQPKVAQKKKASARQIKVSLVVPGISDHEIQNEARPRVMQSSAI